MSINLKNSFKNKVALPLTMALSIVAAPVVMAESPASASASKHSANTTSVSYSAPTQREYSVKIKNLESKPRKYAEFWAAGASGKSGKMVILYGGTDKELQLRVQEGASNARDNGIGVLAMAVGDYDPDIEIKNRDSFIVFVDGARVIKPRNPTKFNPQDIESLLANVHMQTAKHSNTLALNNP